MSEPSEDQNIRPSAPEAGATNSEQPAEEQSFGEFVRVMTAGTYDQVKNQAAKDIARTLQEFKSLWRNYCPLVVFRPPSASISSWEVDRLSLALAQHNGQRKRDVLLVLFSYGGSVEPAYKISKLCKSYAKSRFVVAIPRQAKSAATLLALGADEIHMGLLSELGPIDPQIGGVPALSISQALNTIAELTQRYPASGEMFARYLRDTVGIVQIGYLERISESAVQYAERLLSSKSHLPSAAHDVAKSLVYDYKDHGFLIDQDEARRLLGNDLVVANSEELNFAEALYIRLNFANTLLGTHPAKMELHLAGSLEDTDLTIWPWAAPFQQPNPAAPAAKP